MSTRRSLSWTSISMSSSISGQAKTEANEVCRRGVRVEGADAHQSMHADLGGQVAVGVLALDQHGGALDARLLAGLDVGDVALEAPAVAPAQVHAQQHLRPVLALRCRRRPALMVRMALARSCSPPSIFWNSACSDQRLESVEGVLQVLADVLAALHPFHEDPGVVLLGLEALQQVEVGLDALAPLHDLLGRRLVLPEVAVGHRTSSAPASSAWSLPSSKIAADVRGPRDQRLEALRKIVVVQSRPPG